MTEELIINEGKTKLIVNHNGVPLTFLFPPPPHNYYSIVEESIRSEGLEPPNMSQLVSLIYAAYCHNDRYSKEIKKMLRERGLWAFTGILYVPGKGAYVQDLPQMKGLNPLMDESELVKKLDRGDTSVRFVPFGYGINYQTFHELKQNALVIALAGDDGAKKLVKIAEMCRNPLSELWSFSSINCRESYVSRLITHWGDGPRLYINARNIYSETCKFSSSFGILKSNEQ